jgi:TFIIF-interacting CTD phosphatase-like protein
MVIKALNIGKFLNPIVFSRESCTILSNGMAIKNIQVLGRHVEDIILIDNSICSFFLYPRNGIYVPSFNGNEKDIELLRLGQFLLTLQDSVNLSNSLHDAGYYLDEILELVNLD